MMVVRRLTKSARALAVAFALAIYGCDNEPTGPGGAGSEPQFSEEITFEEFESQVTAGDPVRVEIELLANGSPLIAREIEVAEAEELADEEELETRVVRMEPVAGACEGTLFVELEGVEVHFNEATDFEDDDRTDITCSEFLDFIDAETTAGRQPSIEAERPPFTESGSFAAREPDDNVFEATEIELEGFGEQEIEITVDDDNLIACADVADAPPDCLGALRVLGVDIVIQAGVTELKDQVDDVDRGEFEGVVTGVVPDADNPETGTVMLDDGTTVRIVVGTEIKDGGPDGRRLRSLTEVKEAFDAGERVEAEGEGVVESEQPLTIVASKVEFEIDDDDDGDDDDDDGDEDNAPGVVEFEGGVTTADPQTRTFMLADGTVVSVQDDGIIDPEGDLFTLQEVATAVADGAPVRAEGDANVLNSGPPAELEALTVKFEVDD